MSSLQVTVRSIPDSSTINYYINKHFIKLNKICKKITYCRVVVDVPQNHKHKGKIYSVGIDVIIPGKELISRKQGQNLFVAIRDGFAAIEKLLEKYVKSKTMFTNKYHIHHFDQSAKQKDTSIEIYN